VFSFAKNQGAFDGVNPIRDAMIPRKANVSEETHAATPDEALAIMEALNRAGQQKARAAVALVFFTGLRPGEARGVCWEDYDGKRLTIRRAVWHTHITSPKTKSSEKPVPVNRTTGRDFGPAPRGRPQSHYRADFAWSVREATRSA
jgi:integrase